MKPPLPPIAGAKRTLECSKLNKPHEKKVHVCCGRKVITLEDMPDEMLQKIFSYLSAHDVIECRLMNRHINNVVDDLSLLPLAVWRHTPSSIQAFYTKEQYELRHRPYLTQSHDYKLVEKYNDKSKAAVLFSSRLFFDMNQRLITANNFTCRKIMTYSDHLKDLQYKNFYHILNEHSLCLLIEKHPKEGMIRSVAEIDLHGKEKHDTIRYDSRVINTVVCKNSGRIAAILKVEPEDYYVELHKLNAGKWTSIFKQKLYLGQNDGNSHDIFNCEIAGDYRSLALKPNDSTIAIYKENNKGTWIAQSSIPCCDNEIKMTFSCDGNHLIIKTDTKTQLWKIDTPGDPEQLYENKEPHEKLFFSGDGQFFIVSAFIPREKSIKIYALSGDKSQGKLSMQTIQTTSPIYTSVYPSDDCSTLLLKPHGIRIFQIYEKNRAGNPDLYIQQDLATELSSYTEPFPFSQNGNSFAVGKVVAELKSVDELEVWQKNKGQWRKKITTPHMAAMQISFNSNGTCLVTVPEPDRRRIKFEGEPETETETEAEAEAAYATSNRTPFPINVLKLDCEGEWIVREFFETDPVMEVEWLPDNNHFITILKDGSVNLWAVIPEIPTADDAENMQH